MTVEVCCGQRPIVQTSHGRKVGFCVRCGTEYDIKPVQDEVTSPSLLSEYYQRTNRG